MSDTKSEYIALCEKNVTKCVFKYIDRMNDFCDEDTAENILREFTKEVAPLLELFFKRDVNMEHQLQILGYKADD